MDRNNPLPGDIIDAKLEPGEYVLNRNAVKAIGKKTLDELNNEVAPRFDNDLLMQQNALKMKLANQYVIGGRAKNRLGFNIAELFNKFMPSREKKAMSVDELMGILDQNKTNWSPKLRRSPNEIFSEAQMVSRYPSEFMEQIQAEKSAAHDKDLSPLVEQPKKGGKSMFGLREALSSFGDNFRAGYVKGTNPKHFMQTGGTAGLPGELDEQGGGGDFWVDQGGGSLDENQAELRKQWESGKITTEEFENRGGKISHFSETLSLGETDEDTDVDPDSYSGMETAVVTRPIDIEGGGEDIEGGGEDIEGGGESGKSSFFGKLFGGKSAPRTSVEPVDTENTGKLVTELLEGEEPVTVADIKSDETSFMSAGEEPKPYLSGWDKFNWLGDKDAVNKASGTFAGKPGHGTWAKLANWAKENKAGIGTGLSTAGAFLQEMAAPGYIDQQRFLQNLNLGEIDVSPEEHQLGGLAGYYGYQDGGRVYRKELKGVIPRRFDYEPTDYGGYDVSGIYSVPAEQVGGEGGPRFYLGEGSSRSRRGGQKRAFSRALAKMVSTPQDSIPAAMVEDYFNQPEEEVSEGNFLQRLLGGEKQDGGYINKYQDGGEVGRPSRVDLAKIASDNEDFIRKWVKQRPAITSTYEDLIDAIQSGKLTAREYSPEEWKQLGDVRNRKHKKGYETSAFLEKYYSDATGKLTPESEFESGVIRYPTGKESSIPHELLHYYASHFPGYPGNPKTINPYIKLDMALKGWLPSFHPAGRRPSLPGKTKLGQWWNRKFATKQAPYYDNPTGAPRGEETPMHPWYDNDAFEGIGTEYSEFAEQTRTGEDFQSGKRFIDNLSQNPVTEEVKPAVPQAVSEVPVSFDKNQYPIYNKQSNKAQSFRDAFRQARREKEATFTWDGRLYTTELKKQDGGYINKYQDGGIVTSTGTGGPVVGVPLGGSRRLLNMARRRYGRNS